MDASLRHLEVHQFCLCDRAVFGAFLTVTVKAVQFHSELPLLVGIECYISKLSSQTFPNTTNDFINVLTKFFTTEMNLFRVLAL